MAVGKGQGAAGDGDGCCSGTAVLRLWHHHGDGDSFYRRVARLLVVVHFAVPMEKGG